MMQNARYNIYDYFCLSLSVEYTSTDGPALDANTLVAGTITSTRVASSHLDLEA